MRIEAKIMGDKEVQRKIDALAKKDNEALKEVITKAVIIIEGKAKDKCPVMYGRLHTSITHEVKSSGKNHTGRVGTNVEYAPFVEFGTGKYEKYGKGRTTPWVYYSEKLKQFVWTEGIVPQPYLFPALKDSRQDIIDLLTEKLKNVKV